MKNIYIIPDIHGRTFWKEFVIGHENEDIIFLGDYTDPYDYENISYADTLANFKEIIEFKKSHINNVTLLLGNHDMSYVAGTQKCRYDVNNGDELTKLFVDNIGLFKLFDYRTINNKIISFSHSVVTNIWLELIGESECKTIQDLYNICNEFLSSETFNSVCLRDMCDFIGPARWGWDQCGSIVWSDVREARKEDMPSYIDFQIFGHSQLRKEYIGDNVACLDVRRGFVLSESGELNGELLKIFK